MYTFLATNVKNQMIKAITITQEMTLLFLKSITKSIDAINKHTFIVSVNDQRFNGKVFLDNDNASF